MDGSNFVLHLYLMARAPFLWAGAHFANECLLRRPGWQGRRASPASPSVAPEASILLWLALAGFVMSLLLILLHCSFIKIKALRQKPKRRPRIISWALWPSFSATGCDPAPGHVASPPWVLPPSNL